MAGAFSFGIEEEYFLVEARTKLMPAHVPAAFFEAATAATAGRVSTEFLQPQIEAISSPQLSMGDARAELRELRQAIAAVAAEHGLAILAAGTHPSARWRDAQQTPKQRYDNVMHDLQMIGERDLLCGLHVHVELPDPERRVEVMYRMLPYLPLLLALSTSSPFWQGRRTGLKGYRLAAYDELPRSGVPELFRTQAEFDAYVATLVRAGVIQDSSYIWWAIRPSLDNPTLELRAPDCCTLVDDAIAIAALYRTLARHLCVNRERNCGLDAVARAVIVENKWRAQRYGVHGTFVMDGGAVTVAELLERTIADTAADAAALGCTQEVNRCRAIAGTGTSADVQLAVFDAQRNSAGDAAALAAVTEWIAAATLQ
ncbi:MAG TPA: carboxylate-amine ligase [Xanthobacteraceae bacterium]|jgi:carboxylate-amine ligase